MKYDIHKTKELLKDIANLYYYDCMINSYNDFEKEDIHEALCKLDPPTKAGVMDILGNLDLITWECSFCGKRVEEIIILKENCGIRYNLCRCCLNNIMKDMK